MSDGALSAEQYAQLAAAHLAYGPIRRAIRVAAISGATLVMLALLSLPFAFFSHKGVLAALGLVVVAGFELRGYALLKRLEARGAKILAWNQVGLTGLVVVYCTWSLVEAWLGPDPYDKLVSYRPELEEPLAVYAGIFRQMLMMVYAIALVVGVAVQVFVIRYYASRIPHIRAYRGQTPGWILGWNQNG